MPNPWGVSESQIRRKGLVIILSRADKHDLKISGGMSSSPGNFLFFVIRTAEMISNSSGGSRPVSYWYTSPGEVTPIDSIERRLSG